jgi:hypothetical protein
MVTPILVWILADQISAAKFSLLHKLNFFALEYSGKFFRSRSYLSGMTFFSAPTVCMRLNGGSSLSLHIIFYL